MRAVLKAAPAAGFEYRTDVEDRAVEPGEVRIAVEAASVCGTDRELVRWSPAAESFGMRLPVVLGHEVAGTVLEVGSAVTRVRTGDRVALESHIACGDCYFCRTGHAHNCARMLLLGLHVDGGFAERLVVDQAACYVLPDDVPLEVGALFESAGVAVHAVQRSGHRLTGESVLVAGGGPIGIVLAQVAVAAGAARVLVVEPNPYRRSLAEKFGALTLDPSADVPTYCRDLVPDRGGFDVAFDCAGVPAALGAALDSLRREGTAVCVGLASAEFSLDTTRYAIQRGLTIKGSYGRTLWSTWELLASLVSSGRVDLAAMISHRLPLSGLGEALQLIESDAAKVLLMPGLPD